MWWCDEFMDIIDIKYFPSGRTRYTLPVEKSEISDISKTLECLLVYYPVIWK